MILWTVGDHQFENVAHKEDEANGHPYLCRGPAFGADECRGRPVEHRQGQESDNRIVDFVMIKPSSNHTCHENPAPITSQSTLTKKKGSVLINQRGSEPYPKSGYPVVRLCIVKVEGTACITFRYIPGSFGVVGEA
jgi:hypothetical protein